jgi:hypothetical protein
LLVPGRSEYADTSAALLQRPAERDQLGEGFRDAATERGDQCLHLLAAAGAVGVAVGGDHALVDVPGGLDLDVFVVREQFVESGLLFVGLQVGAGVKGPPGAVEGVVGAAAVPMRVVRDAAWAAVQRIARRGARPGTCP